MDRGTSNPRCSNIELQLWIGSSAISSGQQGVHAGLRYLMQATVLTAGALSSLNIRLHREKDLLDPCAGRKMGRDNSTKRKKEKLCNR
eukprot:1161110-Pelagomonas_calceolata.AAC.14